MLEPLGRSQVLAYLTRLSSKYQFTIISFEKQQDLLNVSEVFKLKAECAEYGIDWQPKRYHKSPRLLATLWDMSVLLFSTFKLSKGAGIELVHCRSYIPAMAAWLVGKFTKVPFVFDMRALWPEEMVDAKRLKRNSLMHKTLNYLEHRLITDSMHIVSLTQAAVPYLRKKYPGVAISKYSVIPTCVDLSRFNGNYQEKRQSIGTMGTVVSGWYHLDWLANTLVLAREIFDDTNIKIITKDRPHIIINEFEKVGLQKNSISIVACSANEVQAMLQQLKFAILFFTSGVSKLGSAPTRMAEFLACGIPILGNQGVGDMASIIKKYNVGVVVQDGSQSALKEALVNMKQLLNDPELEKRCKETAKAIFSADIGAQSYSQIYYRVVNGL